MSCAGPGWLSNTPRIIARLSAGLVTPSFFTSPRAKPNCSGWIVNTRTRPSFSSATRVGAPMEISSMPSSACTTSTCSLPSFCNTSASGSTQCAENANHLVRRAGGVGKRPEQVEHGAHAHLPARADGMLHGAVKFRREQKTDADLAHALRHLLRRKLEADARRFEHVGAAGFARYRAIAVLRYPPTGGGDHECRGGRDIKAYARRRRRCRRYPPDAGR